ncbi:hypothetical protein BK131_03450 [Paenibacillus amylolyticus]|uniref:Uncharacterized protein n=1 Tax=Paenibacillus amylolyticus TaxID=1451 RepID=A0A1R1C4I1_PAEAM|nr:hypothetical protein [Paenibacillus amylolyticus]OMF17042.1 hypothetical protein BK131_03450 [Paenibacillus amylolyticus]
MTVAKKEQGKDAVEVANQTQPAAPDEQGKGAPHKSKEQSNETVAPQFYATLERGKTFDVGGIVFKVGEEKEVTESLHSRLANNALFSVRKD